MIRCETLNIWKKVVKVFKFDSQAIHHSPFTIYRNQGQTAIEYMLLLGVVVALVLIGFKVYLPQTRASANIFFNRAAIGIMGKPNPCGDGVCDPDFEDFDKCPVDC